MPPLELDIADTTRQASTYSLGAKGVREQMEASNAFLNGVALLAVALLGLIVRAHGLTDYGLWFDEAYHVELIRLPTVAAMLEAVLANPPSDPLYVLLLRPWADLFGHGDLSVRSLSVVLGTATIPATYWLGRVAAGRAAGLFGALLLAISPYAVEFGQQASLYVLASLATTLALAAGLRWRGTGSRKDAVLYVALGTGAIYSHYVLAVILGLFGLIGMYAGAGARLVTRRAWIAAHALFLLVWTPWLLVMTANWLAAPTPRAALRNPATTAQVIGALVQFSSGTAALLQRARVAEALGLAAGGLLLLGGWLAGSWTNRRALRQIIVVSGLVFVLPALISAATGLWLFVPHFMVFLLPAIFVVFGAGVLYVSVHDRRIGGHAPPLPLRYLHLAAVAAWLAAQVWGLALYYRHPPHGADGLRELAATLSREARPGDLVLVTPPALQASLAQYYGGETHGLPADFDLRRIYQPYDPATWHNASLATFNGLVEGRTRLWLVYRSELDEGGRLLAEARSRYGEPRQHRYAFATLYMFEGP